MNQETSPYGEFISNAYEVMGLSALTVNPTFPEVEDPPNVETLTKAALVLLVACWETFIEETARSALNFLVQNAKCSDDIPKTLKKSIIKELKDDAHELKIWELAGDGWKQVAIDHTHKMLHRYIGPFNTPKAGNIDNLFREVLGIENITTSWKHENITAREAAEELKNLIEIRGSIAHTVKSSKALLHRHLNCYIWILTYLSYQTNALVREHVYTIVGKYPWSDYHLIKFEEIQTSYKNAIKVIPQI